MKNFIISVLLAIIIFLVAPFEGAGIYSKVFFAVAFTFLFCTLLMIVDDLIEQLKESVRNE